MGHTINGSEIDTFNFCFVDYDCKSNTYPSKEDFLEAVGNLGIAPTRIVDSGNGIHAYWQVSDLDAMSYLRLTRRLMRALNTDEAVGQIFQLMRLPETVNTKKEYALVQCELLFEDSSIIYTCEQLDKLLPAITNADETHCQQHYNKTMGLHKTLIQVNEALPPKFGKLLHNQPEIKKLFANITDDRSRNDYHLANILMANDFTKDEAMSVLINTAKASSRSPVHRISYAQNIVDKIWTYDAAADEEKKTIYKSVGDIIKNSGQNLTGDRIPCYKWIDNTQGGFRRGQVMGLVAGSGVGKTSMALNIFMGFAASNPELHHFFVPLEQVDKEIANRWQIMCGTNTKLHDKVHIMSNYDENGQFRDLSLSQIKESILDFIKTTGNNVGCVVIDHIGVLCNNNKLGQDEGVKQIAKAMKGFAIETNTFLIMQSQTSREKAGIGDKELNKDAAFGTSVFENFCDWLVTLWQPLKRCHGEDACPTITAFKFCKIRHKKARQDLIKEDVPYYMYFDSDLELMRDLSQDEVKSFEYFLPKATNKRNSEGKNELIAYQSVPYQEGAHLEASINSDRHSTRH